MEHGEQGWGELGAGAQGASGEEGRAQVQRPGTPGVRSEAWVPAQWLQEAEGRGQLAEAAMVWTSTPGGLAEMAGRLAEGCEKGGLRFTNHKAFTGEQYGGSSER